MCACVLSVDALSIWGVFFILLITFTDDTEVTQQCRVNPVNRNLFS